MTNDSPSNHSIIKNDSPNNHSMVEPSLKNRSNSSISSKSDSTSSASSMWSCNTDYSSSSLSTNNISPPGDSTSSASSRSYSTTSASSKSHSTISTSFTKSKPVVFFLDWDDNLFPTTDAYKAGIFQHEDGEKVTNHLSRETCEKISLEVGKLETKVLSLLQSATNAGRVFIVTSRDEEWVQLSAERLLPTVHAFIEDESNAIKVMSTRVAETGGSFDGQDWKKKVLSATFDGMDDPHLGIDVIVIGDSSMDIFAARDTEITFNSTGETPVPMKAAKLVDRSIVSDTRKQFEQILGSLDNMVTPSDIPTSYRFWAWTFVPWRACPLFQTTEGRDL